MQEVVIFWFRRDLRWEDNHGLFKALSSGMPVLPIFIFDTDILDKLDDKKDMRLQFIYENCRKIHVHFRQFNSGLRILHGRPIEIWKALAQEYSIKEVYTNQDYEPYAINRDNEVKDFLATKNISFHTFKDQVVFEKSEVTKADGLPYTVFTPYSKVWKAKWSAQTCPHYASEELLNHLFSFSFDFPAIETLGFEVAFIDLDFDLTRIKPIIATYDTSRNFPALPSGTTRMGVHLRFGTVSARKLAQIAVVSNETWLNELIWREFFMQILFHFPHVVTRCFKPQYEAISWRNNEEEFALWCQGRTGYPIVDAGMRELNETGFMHNRVRMIVASFLTKHLLIDWRWGEAYFASKLLDYDLSANNGNWQWAAGTGCDAAPYFRIFNPAEQTRKFDHESKYIEKWLTPDDLMTPPMVEHSYARVRALETYKKGLGNG
jgi:deoxyribodipyrimidine photo-lyase